MRLYPTARKSDALTTPANWQALPSGQWAKRMIEQELVTVSETCFGYHLVKLGNLSSDIEMSGCKINHHVSQYNNVRPGASTVAKSTALPYMEKSVDAFLLAHELDFSHDPHQIMREVDRCLVPNGHVIIVGYNPISLAGLAKLLRLGRRSSFRDARFFTRGRVKDWLGLLGYQVVEQSSFAFSELVFNRRFSKSQRTQRFMQKYLSFFGSFYVIVGKKREFPLSLVKPVWKPKPKFAAVGASMRVGRQEGSLK
ncbi:MAG: class I SAM-dependent methyltransferase [Aestuariibacter sp.]